MRKPRAVLVVAVLVLAAVSFQFQTAARAQPASLQVLIDAAPASSILLVPAGVYREQVTVSKPLTIDGQNQAEIRGADVWTAWSQTGSTWTSERTLPALPYHIPAGTSADPVRCADGSNSCLPPEEVFK